VTTSVETSVGTNGQTTVYTIITGVSEQTGICDAQGSQNFVECNNVDQSVASSIRVSLVQVFLCFAIGYTLLLLK
jgi:hypothetical protein